MQAIIAYGDLIQALLYSAAKRAGKEGVRLSAPGDYVWCQDPTMATSTRCSLDAIIQLDQVPKMLQDDNALGVRRALDAALCVYVCNGRFETDHEVTNSALRLANAIGLPYQSEAGMRNAYVAASPWPKQLLKGSINTVFQLRPGSVVDAADFAEATKQVKS